MKKRILSILLICSMVLTMLPTTAFASVSNSLGNTPEENQAILEQLSALTGGSSFIITAPPVALSAVAARASA